MKLQKINIADLKQNDKNVRVHSPKQIEAFKKSIKSFGVIRPIVVDENNTILAGHGLYKALCETGVKQADCLVINGLSEKEKNKLLLADNKIYSLGQDNFSMIDEILQNMDGDFDIPGYDFDILQQMYGVNDIEEEIKSVSVDDIISPVTQNAEPIIEPNKFIVEAREEAEREHTQQIVCPNCGEVIEL